MTQPAWCPNCTHSAIRHDTFGCLVSRCRCDLTGDDLTATPVCLCVAHVPLPEPLTRQLVLVLRAIAAGKQSLEIAQQAHLSIDTIKTHTRQLYRRLGANDRAHAVAIGYATGLLRPADANPGRVAT